MDGVDAEHVKRVVYEASKVDGLVWVQAQGWRLELGQHCTPPYACRVPQAHPPAAP